jgi:hypothetical protein
MNPTRIYKPSQNELITKDDPSHTLNLVLDKGG